MAQRIARLHTYHLVSPLPEPYGWAWGRVERRETLLVRLRTDDGAEGWGECAGPAAPVQAIIQDRFAACLLGLDALATDVVWNRLWQSAQPEGRRGASVAALSGIDMALWDLKGRIHDRSVSELFGGRGRERVPCAASGLYFRDGPELERVPKAVETARGYFDAGFRAVAVQLGRNLAYDTALIRALREALPTAAFTAEAHGAYDLPEALTVARILEEARFSGFDDPLSPECPELLSRLAARTRVPLAAGRHLQTRWDFQRLFATEGVGFARVNLAFCGGASEAMHIRAIATSHGINVAPVAPGTMLNVAAALHFLASDARHPGRPDVPPPLLRLDGIADPLRDVLFAQPVTIEDGIAQVPAGPGLGVTLDLETMRSFCACESEIAR